MFLVLDDAGGIAFLSDEGRNLLGLGRKEVIGTNWFDRFVAAKDRTRALHTFRELMSGNLEPHAYLECHFLTQKGEKRVFAWHNTTLRDDTGKISGTLSFCEDITVQRGLDEALRADEESFKTFVNTVPAAIALLDMEGKLLSCNPTTQIVTGYRAEHLEGQLFHDMIALDTDHARRIKECFEEIARGDGKDAYDLKIKHRDGTTRLLDVKHRKLTLPAGVPPVLIVARDVTERRRAEEALRKI